MHLTEILQPGKIEFSIEEKVQVDVKFEGSPRIAAEIYAHIGKLKPAQQKKVGTDILKLITVKRLCEEWKDADLYFVFACEEAMASTQKWIKLAAKEQVTMLALKLESDTYNSVKAAQVRQNRGNRIPPELNKE